MIVDPFAGPGGWDTGARLAGYTGPIIGIEWDEAACRTGIAAGHPRIQADVSTFDPSVFAGLADGMTISPPCQGWSAAGDRKGEIDRPAVYRRMAAFAAGREPDVEEWADPRSHLTAEPMRWAVALKPRWIACEQVPAVLPLWKYLGELLRKQGYNVWSGILSAEEYGVPQTRKRAILIARRDGIPAAPPAPTHQPYRAGQEASTEQGLFGDLLPPPVSMADALGWPDTWSVEYQRGKGMAERHGDRPHRPAPAPAPAPTIRAGSGGVGTGLLVHTTPSGTEWTMRNGPQENAATRTLDEPAGTVYCSRPGNLTWALRNGNQANACTRSINEPAGTLFFGQRTNAVDWIREDARMYPAGLHGSYDYSRSIEEPSPTIKGSGSGGQYVSDGKGTVRVSVAEAAVLQSFPADYPWQGTKSAQYRQVGDAVPPRLAAAVLGPLFDQTLSNES